MIGGDRRRLGWLRSAPFISIGKRFAVYMINVNSTPDLMTPANSGEDGTLSRQDEERGPRLLAVNPAGRVGAVARS